MITFFLLLLLGIVLYPLVRIWLMMRRMRRGLRRVRQQSYSDHSHGYNDDTTQQSRVLSDVEEDAEWECVDAPRVEVEHTTHVITEEQITDAEFEEVKLFKN